MTQLQEDFNEAVKKHDASPTWGPLVGAALHNDIEVVKILLDHGIDIEERDGVDSNTALHRAAHEGHLDMVKLLIERGAPINAVTSNGTTALNYAAAWGHPEVVRFLIEKGADVNVMSSFMGTALMHASFSGHEDCVRLLIENGADVNIKDDRMTAEKWAEAGQKNGNKTRDISGIIQLLHDAPEIQRRIEEEKIRVAEAEKERERARVAGKRERMKEKARHRPKLETAP